MKDEPITYVFAVMIFIAGVAALMVTLLAVMEFFDGSWSEGLKTLGVALFLWFMTAGYGWYLWGGLRAED